MVCLRRMGNLELFCGVKSRRELVSGWKYHSRFLMIGNSKSKCNGWYSSQLRVSRKMLWCLLENLDHFSPNWNHGDQFEDGCQNKVWDPGSHKENQLWEPMVCVELHQGLELSSLKTKAYWRFKHWWMFKDSFKHKPP